jgi:glycosyltransferase involved in cell wall biosynthesis
MKNVLFIGPYKQADGWGEAARQYIRALIASGVNLTIRPVFMGNSICEAPVEFLQYEDNKLPHYDCVIQNVLPHLLDYDARFGKNIALLHTETTRWQNVWASRLSNMDEIWAPSYTDLFNLENSGIDHEKIRVIPIPTDVTKYERSYESKELDALKERNSCIFYFIGEFIQRKGMDKLIQAFHTEFEVDEPVDLLIKTSKGGTDPNKLAQELNNHCNRIKSILRIYSSPEKYKKEMFITNRLPDDDLCALHTLCNYYVCPSMGESWNLPTIDALGFGKPPIVVDGTGPRYMVDDSNGFIVPSQLEYVMVLDPPLPDLYTGREIWHSYTVYDLGKCMRQAFAEWQSKNTARAENGMAVVYELQYNVVGELIKERL